MTKRIAGMQRVIFAIDDSGRAVYITREWLKALLADIGDATVTNVTNVTNQTTENITQVVGSSDDLAPRFDEADCIAQAGALIDALRLSPAVLPTTAPDDLTPPSAPFIAQDLGTEGMVSFLLAKVAELEKDIEGLKQGYQL